MRSYTMADLVCEEVRTIEHIVKDRISQILFSKCERFIPDAVQDVYIDAIDLFGSLVSLPHNFKEQILKMSEDIAFGYFRNERGNPARPIKELPKNWGGDDDRGSWASIGDAYQWERIEDYTGHGEREMVALETLASIKEVKGAYLSFWHAKEFVAHLNLTTKEAWDKYCNGKEKLPNIPCNPHEVYKQFKSWNDWLGIDYLEYDNARNWVQNNLSLKSISEWKLAIPSLPKFIHPSPDLFYKEWVNWYEFLGLIDNEKFLDYKSASKWAQEKLSLETYTENSWNKYKLQNKLPENIPPNPESAYKHNGWQSWYRFLSPASQLCNKYDKPYSYCRKWVLDNLPYIDNRDKWDQFVAGYFKIKKPDWLPPNPQQVFIGKGWHGWNTFFRRSQKDDWKNSPIGQELVKIKYKGEAIWVKPTKRSKEGLIGEVVTVLSSFANQQIEFTINDVYGFGTNGKGMKEKIKKNYPSW